MTGNNSDKEVSESQLSNVADGEKEYPSVTTTETRRSGDTMEINFGVGGNDELYLGIGWSGAEPGFRWMIGDQSQIVVDCRALGDSVFLEIECNACISADIMPSQRLTILVNGVIIGQVAVFRPTTFAFPLENDIASPLHITFEHPDFVRPRDLFSVEDDRELSIQVVRVRLLKSHPVIEQSAISCQSLPIARIEATLIEKYNINAVELLCRFESIGHDCEFGLLQRQFGAEPMGLFRFGDLDITAAVRGLNDFFRDIARREELTAVTYVEGGEYHIHHSKYKFRYHANAFPNEITPEALCLKHMPLLEYSKNLFIEKIENAERIFVFKRDTPTSFAEALALFLALRRVGTASFLYVTTSDQDHPPGMVERLHAGFLRGYIRNFWGGKISSIARRDWLEICLNAFLLSTGDQDKPQADLAKTDSSLLSPRTF